MATVSSVVTAIGTALDKLTWIDTVSTSEYLPAVTVASCACLITPFNQASTVELDQLSHTSATFVHRIQVEFWFKHIQGTPSTTLQKARDAGTLAIAQLFADDGTGYTLARGYEFTEAVAPEFTTHANVPWLVSLLTVPVENEVSI